MVKKRLLYSALFVLLCCQSFVLHAQDDPGLVTTLSGSPISAQTISLTIRASVYSKVTLSDRDSRSLVTPTTADFAIGQDVTLRVISTGYLPFESHFKVTSDTRDIFAQMIPDPRWKHLSGVARFSEIQWFQGNTVFHAGHVPSPVGPLPYGWVIYSPNTETQSFSQNSPFANDAVELKKKYPFLDLVTANDVSRPRSYVSPNGSAMLYLRPVFEGNQWQKSTFWFADLETGHQVDTNVPGRFSPRAVVWLSENEALINSDNNMLDNGYYAYLFQRNTSEQKSENYENWADASYTLYPGCKGERYDEFDEHIHSPMDIQLLHTSEFSVTNLQDFQTVAEFSWEANTYCSLQAVAANSTGRYVLIYGCCQGGLSDYLIYDRLLGKVQIIGGTRVVAARWIDDGTVRTVGFDSIFDYDVITGQRTIVIGSDEWDTTTSEFPALSPDGRYIATVHKRGGDLPSETVLVREIAS